MKAVAGLIAILVGLLRPWAALGAIPVFFGGVNLCGLPEVTPYVEPGLGLVFFWNVCPTAPGSVFYSIPINYPDFCAPNASVCVAKRDVHDGHLIEFAKNAGTFENDTSVVEALDEDGETRILSMTLAGGPCSLDEGADPAAATAADANPGDGGQKRRWTTEFRFVCNDDYEYNDLKSSDLVAVASPGRCRFLVSWRTSMACTGEKQTQRAICGVDLPLLGNLRLDLDTLRSSTYYTVQNKDLPDMEFHLNICGRVSGSPCGGAGSHPVSRTLEILAGSPSVFCMVQKDQFVAPKVALAGSVGAEVSYDNLSGDIKLEYTGTDASYGSSLVVPNRRLVRVELRFQCDKRRTSSPEIVHLPGDTEGDVADDDDGGLVFRFVVRTKNVCLSRASLCRSFDRSYKTVSDLSSLRAGGVWRVEDPREGHEHLVYYLSICRPVSPSATEYNCTDPLAGVCQVDTRTNTSVSLGRVVPAQRVETLDGSAAHLQYEGGAWCRASGADEAILTQSSTAISFWCGPEDKGPRLVQVEDECHGFVFEWVTPAACPVFMAMSKSCTIDKSSFVSANRTEDRIFYDLRGLHDSDKDIRLELPPPSGRGSSSGSRDFLRVNLCKGLRDGSCGNHSGHEVSVCLNDAYVVGHSPEVLTYDNGRISAELSGEQCRNRSFLNRDLNPTFKGTLFFTCDHNATGAGHLTLLSVAEDGCGYSMNWITSAACVDLAEVECQAKGSDGTVFNLWGLMLHDRNYVVESEYGMYVINVCRNLVRDPSTASCPPEAAVCYSGMNRSQDEARQTEDGSWTFISGGRVTKPPYYDQRGNHVILRYNMGHPCEDRPGQTYSTMIFIYCRRGEFGTKPLFYFKKGCYLAFNWYHDAGCPQERSVTVLGDPGRCVFRSGSGLIFDLGPIVGMKIGGSHRDGTQDYEVLLKVCSSFEEGDEGVPQRCRGSGVCLVNNNNNKEGAHGPEVSVAGQDSGQLRMDLQGNLFFRYQDGEECPADRGQRLRTTVVLVCSDLHRDNLEPPRANAYWSGGCEVRVTLFTALACQDAVFCEVEASPVDLGKLMNYHGHFSFNVPNSLVSGNVSICKPLGQGQDGDDDGVDVACAGSALCLTKAVTLGDGSSWTQTGWVRNYGRPVEGPKLDLEDEITLRYSHGDRCAGNPEETYRAQISFTCNFGAYPGTPKYLGTNDSDAAFDEDACEIRFQWETAYACPEVIRSLMIYNVDDGIDECKFHNPVSNGTIDLTPLSRTRGLGMLQVGGSEFWISACGARRPNQDWRAFSAPCMADETAGNICSASSGDSFGRKATTFYDVQREALIVHYADGNPCGVGTARARSAEIHFSCDPEALPGVPSLDFNDTCHLIFSWATAHACVVGPSRGPKEDLGTVLVCFVAFAATATGAFMVEKNCKVCRRLKRWCKRTADRNGAIVQYQDLLRQDSELQSGGGEGNPGMDEIQLVETSRAAPSGALATIAEPTVNLKHS